MIGGHYAMVYETVSLVAKNTGQSVEDVLRTLSRLDEYAKQTGQR